MKKFRKGLAVFLLLALCFGNVLSVSAAAPADPSAVPPSAEAPKPVKQEQQDTRLTADVAAAAPSYYVTIPESLELGRLDPGQDFEKSYTVSAEVTSGTVTVTAREQSFALTGDRSSLDARNRFGQGGVHVFDAAGSCTGLVTIGRDQIAAAEPGLYSGTLHFDISFQPGTVPPTDPDPDPVDPDPSGTDPVDPEPSGTDPIEPEPSGTDPVDPEPSGTDPVDPPNPQAKTTYYTARADMLHETKDQPSMCDGLFHRYADIAVTDGMARLTLYVADPIPQFDTPENRPPVRDVQVTYNGLVYDVTMDYDHPVMKQFEEKPGFVPAGEHSAAPVTFTIPFEAVKAAETDPLMCSAYVNAVMKTDVNFRLSLTALRQVEQPDADKPAPPPTVPVKPPKPVTPPPTQPVAPPEPVIPQGGLQDGRYTAPVSMRNETNFSKESMCHPLFFRQADITVSGDSASVKLYVIDPVPAFPEEGTPVSNMSVQYKGQSYPATVGSGAKVNKNFPAKSGFIEPGGTYPATPITFTIPKEALAASASQELMCHTYVNAVMHRDVDFYLVFGTLSGGSTSGGGSSNSGGGATAGGGSADAPSDLFQADGAYNAAVSMRKMNHFSDPSMCDPLFFPRADITVKGTDAELTFYVIDPIPKFDSPENRPPVKNARLQYEGKEYPAAFTEGGTEKRHFEAAPGFIETPGEYPFGTIKVTVPVKAVEESRKEKLTCTAYVNAVMKTDVEFYVVLDDIQEGPADQTESSEAEPDYGDIFDLELEDTGDIFCYESDVSMRRADDFQKESMCDPLFYEKADLLFGGDTAELTLYIIDPVPKFADEGTPLSDVIFLYEDKAYLGKQAPDAQVDKHFAEAPGFIPEAGDYAATPVKVVLPKAAIADSLKGGLKCQAYINTVMHTTQQFHVVLDNLTALTPVEEAQADGPIRIDTGMGPAAIGIALALIAVFGYVGTAVLRRRR